MSNEFAPRKAQKHSVKLKMAIQGPSGSGKTEGSLALAKNFIPNAKILVVDTENDSASLYADRYDFDTISLAAPYTSDRYKKAMQVAADGGYDVLIVDSLTQQWDGEGGILRRKEALDRQPGSNSYTNWSTFTPEHTAFVEFIKQLPIHTICTMRTKQEYVLETNAKGKQQPRKVGTAPIQRDGLEYEFTLVFDVNMAHRATASKNRTTLFQDDEPIDLASPGVAGTLRDWLANGLPPIYADSVQVQKFWDACGTSGKTKEEVRAKLAETGAHKTTEITLDWYEVLMEWATPPARVPEDVMALFEETAP